MSVQIGHVPEGAYFLVIGAVVAMTVDEKTREQLASFPLRYLSSLSFESDANAPYNPFTEWLSALDSAPEAIAPIDVVNARYFAYLLSVGFDADAAFVPPMPPPHLPFWAVTNPNDVFYRWEPFPVSRRINQHARTISPGTFAAPESEVGFISSGFSAVARYALPLPFPACWRWEIQPVVTNIRCGALRIVDLSRTRLFSRRCGLKVVDTVAPMLPEPCPPFDIFRIQPK